MEVISMYVVQYSVISSLTVVGFGGSGKTHFSHCMNLNLRQALCCGCKCYSFLTVLVPNPAVVPGKECISVLSPDIKTFFLLPSISCSGSLPVHQKWQMSFPFPYKLNLLLHMDDGWKGPSRNLTVEIWTPPPPYHEGHLLRTLSKWGPLSESQQGHTNSYISSIMGLRSFLAAYIHSASLLTSPGEL